MKRSNSLLFFFLVTISVVHSQKLRYGGMQQLGVIFSESRISTSFNFINGVRFKSSFAGVGIDAQFNSSNNYYSIPFNTTAVFADARYYINKKKNLFALADGGINFINEKMNPSSGDNYKKLLGYYCGFGFGFKAKIGEEVYYSFDVNYTIKQTRYSYSYTNFRNELQTEKFDQIQQAILIRMGIEIF